MEEPASCDVSGSTNEKLRSIKGDSQSQTIANIIQRIEERKDRRNSNGGERMDIKCFHSNTSKPNEKKIDSPWLAAES